MRIHRLQLRQIRQFDELDLDLSAPLTLIGGPNGVGKTVIQKALLAAMFLHGKKDRDTFISRFDPDSSPLVTLYLSRGNGPAEITLTRKLTDETGEWKEGATTVKGKGKALARIQESLPICSDAAALLLWGLQEELAKVVSEFPSDGHTLLTAATIKGAGPDPKALAAELEKQINKAKKTGKDPGSLIRAKAEVDRLEAELSEANTAKEAFRELGEQFAKAKGDRDLAEERRRLEKTKVDALAQLERLLDAALKASKKTKECDEKQKEWDGLEEQINRKEKSLISLREDRAQLMAELRVAKDRELDTKVQGLKAQITVVEDAERKRNGIDEKLQCRKRPSQEDQNHRQTYKTETKTNSAKIEASGVRYTLSVEVGPRIVQLSEDNSPPVAVEVQAGQVREGIVGDVVVIAEGLRLAASGKEDIAALKRSLEQSQNSLKTLFQRFAVSSEGGFDELVEDTTRLIDEFNEAKNDVAEARKGSTLSTLKTNLELAEKEREKNRMSQADIDACSDKLLGPSAEIEKKLVRKQTELDLADEEVRRLKLKRPSEAELSKLQSDLGAARTVANKTLVAFHEVDELKRESTPELLEEIKQSLAKMRADYEDTVTETSTAQNEVTRLATELKHSGPKRPIPSIEDDFRNSHAIHNREQVFQDARGRLKQRIEQKVEEMAAGVPRELGARVSQYYSNLTCGCYANVSLTNELAVTRVRDQGQNPQDWEPHHLSTGERNQAALAMKIAVARALAETNGTVFVILDDSMASFDPSRRAATEQFLLDLVGDGKLQVIFLTCHTDWAADWKKRAGDRLQYIELAKIAKYYRPPVAVTLSGQRK